MRVVCSKSKFHDVMDFRAKGQTLPRRFVYVHQLLYVADPFCLSRVFDLLKVSHFSGDILDVDELAKDQLPSFISS